MNKLLDKQVCSKCGIMKPLSEFHTRKDSVTGYRKDCKLCNHETQKIYRKQHKEELSQKMKLWSQNNKEYLDNYQKEYRKNNIIDRRLACKKWSSNNKEYLREYHKKHYEANKEHKKKIVKKYRLENPERVKVARYNRLSRIIENGGVVSEVEWKEIKNKYNNKCLCCGSNNIPLDMDHIVPLSLGGKNIKDNIQPLCRSCNARKNAKTIDYRPKEARK